MRKLSAKTTLFVTAILVSVTLNAQPSTFVKENLDSYIQEAMLHWQVPAVSIAIVKDGKVILTKGYGALGKDSNQRVDENTLFMIGSNTKLFTATALAIAEQEKKLLLDDRVNKWLPYFKLKDSEASANTNIKDVLSHRLGFESYQGDFTYWASTLSREEIVRRMALVEPYYPFRTTWGYYNAGFVAAGEVLLKATGIEWESYIRSKILAPLNMRSTLMLSEEVVKAKDVALPYTVIDGELFRVEFPIIDNIAAAATISSNAKDMAKWLLAQLDDGKFKGSQAISKGAILATRQPQTIKSVNVNSGQQMHIDVYGLGVTISDRSNRLLYWHRGAVDGYNSIVAFIPEERLGVVVLSNTDNNGLHTNLAFQILDSYLDVPFENYSNKEFAQYKQELVKERSRVDSLNSLVAKRQPTSVPLKEFEGEYCSELYGKVSIKLEEQKLVIYFSNHPKVRATLEHLVDNRFLCNFSVPAFGKNMEIPFVIKNNRVDSFTLWISDFIELTPYNFVKIE